MCLAGEISMLQAAILVLSNHRFLIVPMIGIVAGVYGFVRAFRLLQRKRLILNTPASKIRSASMGLVEISGIAVGPHVITSPLKQLECYYYRSIAWELKRHGSKSEWVKVADETLHVPFYVDDSTDKLLVNPSSAEMDLQCDFTEEYVRSGALEAPEVPTSVSEFLARHRVNPNTTIKIEERCIKPESFLFVLGTLSQNPGLDMSLTPTWAVRAGQVAVKVANNGQPVEQQIIRLSEAPVRVPAIEMTQQQKIAAALAKAGLFAVSPWTSRDPENKASPANAIPAATLVEEKSEPVNPTGFDLHPPVVLMRGSNEPTFFISWRSQRDMFASLGWMPTLMIWGSPALVLACVYFLLTHFR